MISVGDTNSAVLILSARSLSSAKTCIIIKKKPVLSWHNGNEIYGFIELPPNALIHVVLDIANPT